MFTPEFCSRLDAAAGVPVELAVNDCVAQQNGSDGSALDGYVVSTKAPHIYARRNSVPPEQALSHIENALSQTFAECGVATPRTYYASGFDTLFIDISDDALWLTSPQPYLDVLAARARDMRMNAPDLQVAKQRLTWHEGVTHIGQDAAVWAALNAANAKPPFTISGDLNHLVSRRDENPLAFIRRAHAACVIREDHTHTAHQHSSAQNIADTYLRTTLVWAYRVSYDTQRHRRTRPFTLALHEVAQAVTQHLEQTPVTRTDSLAIEAARNLFARSLACAHLAAPVPA